LKAHRILIPLSCAGALLLGVTGTATANRGNDAETVRMLDDCDPATFNAALGEGTCVGDGDTTIDEFFAELANGGDDHWRNNPRRTEVGAGERVHIVNRGGEFHTFTKVASFADGGCVPQIDDVLGVPTRDPAFCGAAFSDPATAVPPGGQGDVAASALTPGANYFQCMIHPWMRTTVVRERHRH
jgi:plastocyanin